MKYIYGIILSSLLLFTPLSFAARTAIFEEGCSYSTPYITSTSLIKVGTGMTDTFVLEGLNFSSESTVSIPGFEGVIENVNYVDGRLEITISTNETEGIYSLIIHNVCSTNSEFLENGNNQLQITSMEWLDLRINGDDFSNLRVRSGMTVHRDEQGMYFSGIGPWASWVKFEDQGFQRGEGTTVEWIFNNNDYFMIGIGSTETNELGYEQHKEAEWLAYFSSANYFYGMFGNIGTPGSYYHYQPTNVSIPVGSTLKLKMENDGKKDARITLYELPSGNKSDWNDESVVIYSFISNSLGTQSNLIPFILPADGPKSRFLGLRLN